MSDEPRFPLPHGEEPVGYREAGAPVSEEKPELPIPEGPLVERKRVVASRPDDPNIALAKAFTPSRRPVPPASKATAAFIALFVAGYVLLQLFSNLKHC